MILVTGGAGFIGSHICEFLLQKGFSVRILDNFSTGSMDNISHLLDYKTLDIVGGDINDFDTCVKACENISAICHHAAFVSVSQSMKNPTLAHQTNVNGFQNMLQAAKISGIRRFIYASSSAVYGNNSNLPIKETEICAPISPYGLSKQINEQYATLYKNLYNIETIGFRYANVFGARQNPDGEYAAVIPKFIQKIKNDQCPTIFGDGTFSRDFVHVSNVVLANYLALTTKNKKCFGQVFNIGTGISISIKSLFNSIKNQCDKKIEAIYEKARDGDIPHSCLDISKANLLLGYYVATSFDNGMVNTC